MGIKNDNSEMLVQILFPTYLCKFKLGRDLTQTELNFLMNLPTRLNAGNVTGLDTELLENKILSNLAEFINSKVQYCFDEIYKPSKNVKLRITQSWINYTKKSEYHHRHTHSNSFMSGVFYVNANKDTDKIVFHNEHYRTIDIIPRENTILNSRNWWYPVETGDLILFPSDLSHSVDMVNTDTIRASLAFNTFPVGYVGNDVELTGLHLRD